MPSSPPSDSSDDEARPIPQSTDEVEDRIVILDEEGNDVTDDLYHPHVMVQD